MPTYMCPYCHQTFHEEGRDNKYRIEGTRPNRKMFWECMSCKEELEVPLCPYFEDGCCHDFYGCEEEFCRASSYESGSVGATSEQKRKFRLRMREFKKLIMRDNLGNPIKWED